MKTKVLYALGASGVAGLLTFLAVAQDITAPPFLTAQPVGRTVDYGANASFHVIVSGGHPLSYQWLKNGLPLVDYANVSGAYTDTLNLVGAAQSDAGEYTVVVSNPAGVVTGAVAVLTVRSMTVFTDDFERGGLQEWTCFRDATPLTNSAARNHSSGGAGSALLTSSRDRMFHNLGLKLRGRAKATFWLYDDGTGQTGCFGELRGYTGAGHGAYVSPGGLKQLFAVGCYDLEWSTNNTGALANEQADQARYQARVYRGTSRGWFNLDAPGAPERSVGWHKFEIERLADGTNVHFYVDGVLGRAVTGADYAPLDCVAIGGTGQGSAPVTAWFDDIKVEDFPWQFDWQSQDTGGTGLFDWMRLRETGTDVAITQVANVFQAEGRNAGGTVGRWVAEEQGASAIDGRGRLDYEVTVPADDAYRIELEARGQNERDRTKPLPVVISLDGEHLGRFLLPSGSGTNGLMRCFTPFIKAGRHTVSIACDNAAKRASFHVEALRLQLLAGADADRQGMKGWVENRLRAQNGIEFAPAASPVSPVCLEGRGQYLSTMRMAAVAEGDPFAIQVEAGAGNRWFANVPLSPSCPTQVGVSYQNEGLGETVEVAWEATNLLIADNKRIRKGDALLLIAAPENASSGVVRISVVGVTNYTTDVATPVAHRFDRAGTFTLVGAFTAGTRKASRTMTVQVVEATLDSPAAWVGKRRYWNCTNIPPEVVLDWDPRLKLEEFPAPPTLGPNARQCSLIIDEAQPRYLVARLGRNGPILASTAVRGFRLFTGADTYLELVETHPDGSQRVETALILSPVLPDVTVGLSVLVSGVTFEDGTVTKTLMAGDFDQLGVCRVRFVRAAGVATSVCHTTKAYQADTLIGWPSVEQ